MSELVYLCDRPSNLNNSFCLVVIIYGHNKIFILIFSDFSSVILLFSVKVFFFLISGARLDLPYFGSRKQKPFSLG